jgi:PAS domain S-box-containing protein
MKSTNKLLTNVERHFAADDVIVTKTDLKGHITYVNRVFLTLSGMSLKEAIGAPHSVIRHPDMPRCVFKLLWDQLAAEREVFAYVLNRSTNGDHYWVFAHVTPSRDDHGKIVAYHSNRRVPRREVIDQVIKPLYAELLKEEERHENRKDGMNAAFNLLLGKLKTLGVSYDEFIFSV